MGVFYDDLPDHEGYAAGRLADGTLTTTSGRGIDLVGWIGACSCGWLDEHTHGPDEDGREAALDRWDDVHAVPLLEQAVPRHVEELLEQARRAVVALADTRPRAAADVLERIDRWTRALRADGPSCGDRVLSVQQRLDAFADRARRGPPNLGR